MLTISLVRRFNVSFQVIPVREWSEEALTNGLNLLDLERIQGELEVDLKIVASLKGTFKTAHPGRILCGTKDIPDCFTQKLCAKQVYLQKSATGPIMRYRGDEERRKLVKEVVCLDWATILLDLTYGFVEGAVAERGEPPVGIPKLRFVRTMLAADAQNDKHFLIEEWLGDGSEFVKYINNGHPVSCVQVDAPTKDHKIAEFLCFAQHVQYNQTEGLAYTSDYQGL